MKIIKCFIAVIIVTTLSCRREHPLYAILDYGVETEISDHAIRELVSVLEPGEKYSQFSRVTGGIPKYHVNRFYWLGANMGEDRATVSTGETVSALATFNKAKIHSTFFPLINTCNPLEINIGDIDSLDVGLTNNCFLGFFLDALKISGAGALLIYCDTRSEMLSAGKILQNLRQRLGDEGCVFLMLEESPANKVVAKENWKFALENGVDMIVDHDEQSLEGAVDSGMIGERMVNRALFRMLKLQFHARQGFKKRETGKYKNDSTVGSSIVLLQNNNLLPLEEGINKVALIGPWANFTTLAYHDHQTLYQQLNNSLSNKVEIHYAPGSILSKEKPGFSAITSDFVYTSSEKEVNGINIKVFDNSLYNGEPETEHVDSTLFLDMKISGGTGKAARLEGYLVSRYSGLHRVAMQGIEKGYMKLGEKETRFEMTKPGMPQGIISLDMNKDVVYPVQIDFVPDENYSQPRLIWQIPEEGLVEEAAEIAKSSDLIVLALGNMKTREKKLLNELPEDQIDLLNTLEELNKPMVIILNFNGLTNIPRFNKKSSLMINWDPPGGSNDLVSLLTGKSNDFGGMPLPLLPGQNIDSAICSKSKDIPYPFGFGLSHTSFKLSNLRLSKGVIDTLGQVEFMAEITNTGDRDGTGIVQFYISADSIENWFPRKRLVDFQQACLKPGETRTVRFLVGKSQLATFCPNQGYARVFPGTYQLEMGRSGLNSIDLLVE